MATQGLIRLNADGTGKALDTVITATAAQHRQVFAIGDSSVDANVGKVDAAGSQQVAIYDAASPTSASLTAADAASTVATGFNGTSIITGTPTASSSLSIAFNGENAVAIQLTGTWVASVSFERSIDNGTTWHQASVISSGQNYSSVTGNGLFFINVAGATNARVRIPASSYTSGTVTASIYAATGIFPLSLVSAVSGMYNATAPTLTDKGVAAIQLDVNGRQIITNGTLAAGEDLVANTLGVTGKPVNSATYAPSFYQMPSTPVTAATIKASAGSIQSLLATNANAAIRYLQIHNTASTPAGAAVPLRTFPLIPGVGTTLAPFQITREYLSSLMYCSTGISFAFSTTQFTYTAATAADHFIDLNYA